MEMTLGRCIQTALLVVAMPLSAIAQVTEATNSPTSFEQAIENNSRQVSFANDSGAKRMHPLSGEPQPTLLTLYTHTDESARTAILEKFPVGTSAAQILREFPLHFILFDIRFDELGGIHIHAEDKPHQIIGTRSLVMTVDKQWPFGVMPVIQYRLAYLGFDADGKLLDVKVITTSDAI